MTDERTEEQMLAELRTKREKEDKYVTLGVEVFAGESNGYNTPEGVVEFRMSRQQMSRQMAAKMLRALAEEIDPSSHSNIAVSGSGITYNTVNGNR